MAIYRGTGSASTTTDQATIDEVTTQATNAANSATSAASSASSAASSASSASSSASTATTQASAASSSATSAASSASAASTSATNAATSATAAAASATTAASEATNAETAETGALAARADAINAQTAAESARDLAQGYKTLAETAYTNTQSTINAAVATATADAEAAQAAAETAATNSATSATASATSATNAATSATNAATSATAASTAQTNAETAQTAAETAQTAAETALDAFDDRYLGAKASAPTTDNDGDPLITGALYYDTTASQLYIWDGSAWDQAAFSVSGAVTSFNTRTGAVTLTSGDVTTALGYTPYNSTNPDSYVTQSAIDTSIANLVDSAPATLDTLNELAAALGDDANFSTTVTNSLATKAPLASPALTGTPTAPTAAANTNTTQVATTAYVQGELANEANWNTAYGWGDHSAAGYAPLASPSLTGVPTAPTAVADTNTTQVATTAYVQGELANEANWNTAYGWGDHSTQNYAVTTGDTMTGALNFGDNVKAQFGASNDLQIYHDSSDSYISDQGTGNLRVRATNLIMGNAAGTATYARGIEGGTFDLYYNNAQKLATSATGVTVTGTVTADGVSLGDNEKAQFGASNDLQIYHDGSNSYVADKGTGNLVLQADASFKLENADATKTSIFAQPAGAVQLKYDNATKLATTSDGVDITGEIYAYRGRGATQTYTTNITTVTPNFSGFTNFVWTLDRNITLVNPSTEAQGQSGIFVFIHSGAGRTVSLSSEYESVGGAGLTLSSTAGAVDIVPYFVRSTGNVVLGQPLLAVS